MQLHPTLAGVLGGVPDPILIASAILVALGLVLVALLLLEGDAADIEPTLEPADDSPTVPDGTVAPRRWRRAVVRVLEVLGVALVVAAVAVAALLVAGGL